VYKKLMRDNIKRYS